LRDGNYSEWRQGDYIHWALNIVNWNYNSNVAGLSTNNTDVRDYSTVE